MKRVLAVLLSAVLSLSVAVVPGIQTLAEEPDAAQKTEGQQEAEVEVQAPSAVLMEASTGAVLYEKDADTGLLTDVQQDIKVDKPVCIKFVP